VAVVVAGAAAAVAAAFCQCLILRLLNKAILLS
jgi:hypothetical protein